MATWKFLPFNLKMRDDWVIDVFPRADESCRIQHHGQGALRAVLDYLRRVVQPPDPAGARDGQLLERQHGANIGVEVRTLVLSVVPGSEGARRFEEEYGEQGHRGETARAMLKEALAQAFHRKAASYGNDKATITFADHFEW